MASMRRVSMQFEDCPVDGVAGEICLNLIYSSFFIKSNCPHVDVLAGLLNMKINCWPIKKGI